MSGYVIQSYSQAVCIFFNLQVIWQDRKVWTDETMFYSQDILQKRGGKFGVIW